MPPKRNALVLRALANDPASGWTQTPVANRSAEGLLAASYVSAFLRHHEMPMTKEKVDRANGARLWQSRREMVEAEHRSASHIRAAGLPQLVWAFNHGFEAPKTAQADFLIFLKALPSSLFGHAISALERHYELCNSFRAAPSELASPPTHLDIFKDERVPKRWRLGADGASNVLVSGNGVLRVWPLLMQPSWDPQNAARDAALIWQSCADDVAELHRSLEDSP